ncbi:polyprenyl diphosphate synthase [Brachybacterium paraconglomeratum]|uniref:polyprenyl diphosphate synthase n=1 Tax=Brachybacterium paraconglomeratum TaxID=173362 RepID=UPI0031E993BA
MTMSEQSVAAELPRHVGLIMDGNRRWARARGYADVSTGHQVGAEHLTTVLQWLSVRGIDHASVYVLSADNIRKRSTLEVGFLFHLIETVIADRIHDAERWQLHVSGDLELLPASTRASLERTIDETRGRPGHLTLAIGYDAHADILGALRQAVTDAPDVSAAQFSVESISQHLAGGPNKVIDLVIRTGGDARISGFFPWQSTGAELHVAQCAWPDLAEADLEAALAHYSRARQPR